MNKTRKLLVAVVALITAVFVIGCDTGLTTIASKGKYAEMTGNITNFSDYVLPSTGDANRTITASGAVLSDYAWWLTYNEIGSTTKYYVKVSGTPSDTPALGTWGSTSTQTTKATVEAVTDGKFKITLDTKAYQLSLYAVPGNSSKDYCSSSSNNAALLTEAVLVGHSYIDLSNDSGQANFTLTTNNLTGTANAHFDVVLDNWGTKPEGKVEIMVRDFLTNEEVKGPGDASLTITVPNPAVSPAPTCVFTQGNGNNYPTTSYYLNTGVASGGTNYVKTLTAGVYNFVVNFYDKTDSKIEFTWSDVMIVLPNRDLTTPVYIADASPKVPSAPLYFMASYDPTSLNATADDYEVYFEWTDTGNLEEYYVLELADMDTDAPTGNDHLIAGLTADFKNGNLETANWNNFIGSVNPEVITFDPSQNPVNNYEYYFEGGLWANNTHMTLTLPMGKKYLARIKAVNAAGSSEYTYVDLAAYGTKKTTVDNDTRCAVDDSAVQLTHIPAKSKFNSDTINIYKVVYHLNGGRYGKPGSTIAEDNALSTAPADTVLYTKDDFVVYNIQNKTEITQPASMAQAPTPLAYWDGIHSWQDSASSPVKMKTKSADFGGSLSSDLMNGKWDDFDTDGDLLIGDRDTAHADADFGFGSLQLVMDTKYHDKVHYDVAAFKYWVSDFTDDPVPSDSSTKKLDISTGYSNFKNLELWAKYQPITEPKPELTGYISYTDPTMFSLNNLWITFNQNSGTAGAYAAFDDAVTAPHKTLSKAAGNKLSLQFTMPKVTYYTEAEADALKTAAEAGSASDADKQAWAEFQNNYKKVEAYAITSDKGTSHWEAQAVISPAEYTKLDTTDQANYTKVSYMYGFPKGESYDSVSVVAYRSNGYEAGYAKTITPAVAGTGATFTDIDISKWNKGQTYRLVFTAKYKKNVYTTSVSLLITD